MTTHKMSASSAQVIYVTISKALLHKLNIFFLQILMSVQKTMAGALSCAIIPLAVTRVIVRLVMNWMWMDTHAVVHLFK